MADEGKRAKEVRDGDPREEETSIEEVLIGGGTDIGGEEDLTAAWRSRQVKTILDGADLQDLVSSLSGI